MFIRSVLGILLPNPMENHEAAPAVQANTEAVFKDEAELRILFISYMDWLKHKIQNRGWRNVFRSSMSTYVEWLVLHKPVESDNTLDLN